MGRRCSPGVLPPGLASVCVGGLRGGWGQGRGCCEVGRGGGSRPLPKPTAARPAPRSLPLPPLFRGCRPPSVWAVVPLVPVWAPGRAGVEGGVGFSPPPSLSARWGGGGGGWVLPPPPSPRWPPPLEGIIWDTHEQGGCKRKRLRCASSEPREPNKKKTQRSVLVRMRNRGRRKGLARRGRRRRFRKEAPSSGPHRCAWIFFFVGESEEEEKTHPVPPPSPPHTTVRGRGRISVQFDRKPARSLLLSKEECGWWP